MAIIKGLFFSSPGFLYFLQTYYFTLKVLQLYSDVLGANVQLFTNLLKIPYFCT